MCQSATAVYNVIWPLTLGKPWKVSGTSDFQTFRSHPPDSYPDRTITQNKF